MNAASNASPKFELSPVQLIAGCLAAITAAVLASFFGVAGTVIGTALGSIVGTAGTALYSHSIRKTQARIRAIQAHEQLTGLRHQPVEARPGQASAEPAGDPTHEPAAAAAHAGWREYLRRSWVMIAVAAAAAFVLTMVAVTGVEAAARKQLWAIVTGHSQPAGPTTTLGGVVGGVTAQSTPTPAPTDQPSGSPSPGAPAVAPTSTPSGSAPQPSSSPTPTAIPTAPTPTSRPSAAPYGGG
ncbi:MAG: hypothetical protein DLM67_05850 [Candidatus Nephthysia bennettiae]|uniref:Uncharacterized protein n=1 Tax=Candidatus Nephthysia bennettiae TaxID=3127016 RepID=A0A934K676_9BACT|nr:hypothetical protein [Candidatus Dormibacteraeota bacterium]MBJ7613072.1 hypothetical protein [Candidatus Dormibacteraeota bacterium]PZR98470.1 MAG: hypothetical protein DLM67_05850 [Candidatus Dormibacteraeota bacterium]